MAITIQTGDLLEAEADALVNTVNCVGVMGKGIALQFKKKWPAAFKSYKQDCDSGKLRPGSLHIHEFGKLAGKPYFIINFPTKDHWRGKSQIEFIKSGLKALHRSIEELQIESIAIPPLGCGNGGLEWPRVEQLIREQLGDLDVEIQLFAPTGAPEAKRLAVRSERPKMTAGRAVLLKLLALYKELDYSLTKVEVQKLCYFAQIAGQPLKLNFEKNQYGPYADSLRHVLNRIDGHFVKGVGDHDQSETELQVEQDAVIEATEFLKSDSESQARLKRVKHLIEGFETPFGMELLATVHWVSHELGTHDLDPVLEGVRNWVPGQKAWNQRKSELMTEGKVRLALSQLHTKGWL